MTRGQGEVALHGVSKSLGATMAVKELDADAITLDGVNMAGVPAHQRPVNADQSFPA